MEGPLKHFAEFRRRFLRVAAGLAVPLACASQQMPSSVPTQPPSQTEESPEQASTSGEAGEASGETGEQAQQTSDAASASESEAEAGESSQSESDRADGAQEASSAAAKSEGSAGEAAERGDSADAAGQTGAGGTERGSEHPQQQAGAAGEAEGAESAAANSQGASASRSGRDPSADERVAEGETAGSGSGSGAGATAEPGERPGAFAGSHPRAGASGSPTESGEAGGAGRESAQGDPSETAGSAGGGIPIDDVPPELLAAFGRGGSGAATEALSGEALQRALERLAEHQSQVDEMIQHEHSAAAASSGDIGTDSTGTGAVAPALRGGEDGRRAEIIGGENVSSVSTASTHAPTDAGAGYRPPPDVGSGSDDDTLAAQLRELAMKETDPVLRERYWEEYRKHKGIQLKTGHSNEAGAN
jgi:hypothetical protein